MATQAWQPDGFVRFFIAFSFWGVIVSHSAGESARCFISISYSIAVPTHLRESGRNLDLEALLSLFYSTVRILNDLLMDLHLIIFAIGPFFGLSNYFLSLLAIFGD